MTREEALKKAINIVAYFEAHFAKSKEAREDAANIIEALEQEPCEDAISRQAVFEQINCWIGSGEYRYTNATHYLTERVKHISPVNPQEPKTGHWIAGVNGHFNCSECNTDFFAFRDIRAAFIYCPYCGAKMIEPQESEVEE